MNKPILALMTMCLAACGVEAEQGTFVPPGTEAPALAKSESELLILDPVPEPTTPIGGTPQPVVLTTLSPTINFTGTPVTVRGSNLIRPPTSLIIRYRFENDAAYLSPTFVSSSELRVTVPAGSRGGRLCGFQLGQQVVCTTNSFTVGNPNGTVLMVNDAQYSVRSARFNGVEVLAPQSIGAASSASFTPVTPGNLSFASDIAFGPAAIGVSNRVICGFNGVASVAANTTTTLTVPRLNVAQLLGHCGVSEYRANYLDFNGLPRQVTLRFDSRTNSWSFLEGNQLLAQGSLTVVTWPNEGPAVTFALTGAGWPNVTVMAPFVSFIAGPAGDQLLFTRVGNW
ncbi:MAG: hypothetical protein QM817_04580 [Archangium sp.]